MPVVGMNYARTSFINASVVEVTFQVTLRITKERYASNASAEHLKNPEGQAPSKRGPG
jgi:hypothetical protein